jgi:hypothetical protein
MARLFHEVVFQFYQQANLHQQDFIEQLPSFLKGDFWQ